MKQKRTMLAGKGRVVKPRKRTYARRLGLKENRSRVHAVAYIKEREREREHRMKLPLVRNMVRGVRN